MNTRRLIATVWLVAVAGCDSTPTSPPPTPDLSVNQSAVALSRTMTSQVTATSTVSNVPTDVTATATWRTDNAEVATVSSGLIVAVGPGTTNITAEHAGQTKTIAVTVRRRTYVTGEVRVDTIGGAETIDGVFFGLDGQGAGGRQGSGRLASFTARMSFFPEEVVVEPGDHTVTVVVNIGPDSARPTYKITWIAPLRIRDLDTSQVVATLSLTAKTEKATAEPARVNWTFVVPTFTS